MADPLMQACGSTGRSCGYWAGTFAAFAAIVFPFKT